MPSTSLDFRASSTSPIGTPPTSLDRNVDEKLEVCENGDTIATTKEEEWVTKKKSEVTTTRQIATRVKRELVLEDGKILSDTGPKVSTTAREDTHTTNYQQTEQRVLASEDEEEGVEETTKLNLSKETDALEESTKFAVEKGAISADGRQLTDVPVSTTVTTRRVNNPDGKVMESRDCRVITRKETDRVREVEESFHLGDITDKALVEAVNEVDGDEDLRDALQKKASQTVLKTGPKLIRDIKTHRETIDTEDKDELRALQPDGTIITESRRETTHEQLRDVPLDDDEAVSIASDQSVTRERACRERLARTEQEDKSKLMAGGRRVTTHLHNRVTSVEAEKEGDRNMDDPCDWDSLSMRMRRQRKLRQGTEHESYLKRPIDFEVEEETRKKETSKWLESHFGSESRSSRDSVLEEVERTEKYLKSKGTLDEGYFERNPPTSPPPPVYANRDIRKPKTSDDPAVKVIPVKTNGYFKGVGEWSQRRTETPRMTHPRSGSPYASDDSPKRVSPPGRNSPTYVNRNGRTSLTRDDSAYVSSSTVHSPPRGSPYRVGGDSDRNDRDNSAEEDYGRPVAPERRRGSKNRSVEERYDSGYRSSSRNGTVEPPPDYSRRPSPEPSPPTSARQRKPNQKTRFAADEERRSPTRKSVGATIGNSIRKLVGKIRSASSERRSKWRAGSRSPSPNDTRTYKHYDNDVTPPPPPAQRYYLGEDPFAGSIYGKEHKYEGASPRRISKGKRETSDTEQRTNFSSTLGRLSHSTSRLNPRGSEEEDLRNIQTLPRKLLNEKKNSPPVNTNGTTNGKSWQQLGPSKRSNSTANVSAVTNGKHVTNGYHNGPVKPVRTYNKSLNRSKSFAIGAPEIEVKPRYISSMNRNYSTMYKSNPHLSRLDEAQEELKSPGIVSIINKSQRDLADAVSREAERKRDGLFGARYGKSPSPFNNGYTNGKSYDETDKKRTYLKGLKERAPELYHTLHLDEDYDLGRHSPRFGSRSPSFPRERNFSEERKVVYSKDSSPFVTRFSNDPVSRLRRGSNSSDNFSETYRYTTKSGDPDRPLITDTVEKVSKKIIPTHNGRAKEIIESREKNSVTTSQSQQDSYKYQNSGTRLTSFEARLSASPIISEKRSSNYRLEKVRDYRNY